MPYCFCLRNVKYFLSSDLILWNILYFRKFSQIIQNIKSTCFPRNSGHQPFENLNLNFLNFELIFAWTFSDVSKSSVMKDLTVTLMYSGSCVSFRAVWTIFICLKYSISYISNFCPKIFCSNKKLVKQMDEKIYVTNY